MVRKLVRKMARGLMLRSGIFYFRQDVKGADGKYRSIRRSLQTSDLHTALRRLEQMKKFMRDYDDLSPEEQTDFAKFYTGGELSQIENSTLEKLRDKDMLVRFFYDQWMAHHADLDELIGTVVENAPIIDLCRKGLPDSALERYNKVWQAAADTIQARALLDLRMQKDSYARKKFEEVMGFLNDSVQYSSWEEYIALKEGRQPFIVIQPSVQQQQLKRTCPRHTIRDIMEDMLSLSKNDESTKKRKRDDITAIVESQGLTLDDEYSKINNPDTIKQMCKWVSERKTKAGQPILNGRKKKMFTALKDLIKNAANMAPDNYQDTPLLRCIPSLKKDPKGKTSSYWPYTEDMLRNIFDPKHDFFKFYPEHFIVCLIALFSGSRTNAASTLQFKDITVLDGIPTLSIFEDHDKKHLKNDETERHLPIAKQLLDWGFVDMIKERQAKIKAEPNRFIFTKINDYNEEKPADVFIRRYHTFLRHIGIGRSDGKIYTFHSYRDTVSNKLEDLGVSNSMAHKLVGWKDHGTRAEHYSKRTHEERKVAIDKLEYSEDMLHLEYWKPIIQERYINQEKYPTPKGRKPKKKQD